MNKIFSELFCDPKTAVRNVLLLLLMIFAVIYAFFQIYPSFSENIKTQTALEVSVFESLEADAYIFRDEHVISGDGGILVTLVGDGDRVSKGQCYANVYSQDDAASLQKQIDSIDRKIEVLEKSVGEAKVHVADVSKTEKNIKSSLDTIYKNVASGDLSELAEAEKKLNVEMNKYDLIVNMTNTYSDEIASLKAERRSIENRIDSASYGLYAAESGNYYGDVDGYENVFNLKALKDLSLSSFEELTASLPESKILNSNFGKIVYSFSWYAVCEIDKSAAAAYTVGNYYSLMFDTLPDSEIRMELSDIISNTAEKNALLVFKCNTSPDGFSYKRKQKIQVINNRITGFAIPKEALRIVDGVTGVYILDGDIVRFRMVNVLTTDEDYYIGDMNNPYLSEDYASSESAEDKKLYKYLSLYDNIIIGGKSLFDGKIVS